jgi:hypothetical protein
MSPEELLDTFLWLCEGVDFIFIKPVYFDVLVYKFIVARLTEEKGELERALSLYRNIQTEIGEWGYDHDIIEQAIIRVLNKINEKN